MESNSATHSSENQLSGGSAINPQSWLEQFVPRSHSRIVFVLVMTCYSVAATEIAARAIALFGFWTVKVDNLKHIRPVRPGVDDTNLIELLLIAPILESLVISAIIELLRRFRFPVGVQLVTAVFVISLVHGVPVPFFCISCSTRIFDSGNDVLVLASQVFLDCHANNCFSTFLF